MIVTWRLVGGHLNWQDGLAVKHIETFYNGTYPMYTSRSTTDIDPSGPSALLGARSGSLEQGTESILLY